MCFVLMKGYLYTKLVPTFTFYFFFFSLAFAKTRPCVWWLPEKEGGADDVVRCKRHGTEAWSACS